jgi:DNA repair protein RecN (Recombination protein N)
MLEQLHIRNLATIAEADIEFGPGFTVLSGETGAGKSILIDALGLVLGTRAESMLVRAGSDKAEISAAFVVDDAAAAREWLAEQELTDADDDSACLVRRVLGAEGRTRAFVNGQPVSAAALRELGERLIEVFGQNESQTLRSSDVQRALLDDFGAYDSLLGEVGAAAQRWRDCDTAIEKLRAQSARDPAQLDYLRHQVRELDALGLADGELERLEADHKRLANAGRLIEDGGSALEQLYNGEDSAHDRLSRVAHLLDSLAPLHEGFAGVHELVAQAQTQAREAGNALARLIDRLDLDPSRLAEMERRLAAIHDLARKHRVRADELPARLDALRGELQDSEQAGGRVAEIEAQQRRELQTYQRASEQLRGLRQTAASKLADAVSVRVRELGMAHARFEIAVEPLPSSRPRDHGEDEVRFDFSANPGQPPRPLSKVASGGELSRVSLALQVSIRGQRGAPTMIFDEVDAGIGGGVADIVGQQLRALGEDRQVLCVTHLGQVAAHARQHLAISKDVADGQTYTRIQPLGGAGRVEEIARMVGGQTATAATTTMARELLKKAANR